MSYEDSFEREADDQRAYDDFELEHLFEHFRPPSIGEFEWALMFDRVPPYTTGFSDAAQAAKKMAAELGRGVIVEPAATEGWFKIRPVDYYESYPSKYRNKRWAFIKALVVEGRYPDIRALASNTLRDPGQRGAIWRHYVNDVAATHERWKLEAMATQTSGAEVPKR